MMLRDIVHVAKESIKQTSSQSRSVYVNCMEGSSEGRAGDIGRDGDLL